MATKILKGAVLATGLIIATEASAHLPAPLIPTALVEDVKSTTADVEFMDYVGTGQVIKLGPSGALVLSYLKSCEHEVIVGGTVIVGTERSEVDGGKVTRTKVACDGGKVEVSSQQATETAATAFRLQNAPHETVVYARAPIIEIPKLHPGDSRQLVLQRIDPPGERFAIKIGEGLHDGGFYDLAKTNRSLTPGATYSASLGDYKVIFKIDAGAKSGEGPIVSRLLRFQSS
jgi:hypothetical protein